MSSRGWSGRELVAALALVGARRGGPPFELLLDDREAVLGVGVEPDRRGVAADDLGKLDVVAHRGRDDDLAALVVVGDDRGHVGHVAAVVLEVEPAGADDPAREADAHRLIRWVSWWTKRSVYMPPPKSQ